MELTKKQQQAVDLAVKKYRNGEKYITIAGLAGVGKTSTVRFIINALAQCGINPETEVCFGTPTGKAAQVLSKKGNKNVYTIHKLLYDTKMLANGSFARYPKRKLGYKVVCVDEVSMVDVKMIKLLLSHDVFCIFCGDNFQIPPISKEEDNHLLEHCDIFLDEVMRQAAESEIIQLSMKIRNRQPIPFYKGKEVQVLPKEQLVQGMLTWADIIICSMNKTRQNINKQMREILHYPEDRIVDGDKITCLRNEWDIISNKEIALINGTIGYLTNIHSKSLRLPSFVLGFPLSIPVISGTFKSDFDDDFGELNLDKQFLYQEQPFLSPKLQYKLLKNKDFNFLSPLQFSYGYAITGHRSQGSEWEKVMVIEEDFPFDKTEHARWLYTCCTRSSSKLILLR